MKVRHGKVYTGKRLAIIQRYYAKRAMWGHGAPCLHLPGCSLDEYEAWVSDFERFMCRGFAKDEPKRT